MTDMITRWSVKRIFGVAFVMSIAITLVLAIVTIVADWYYWDSGLWGDFPTGMRDDLYDLSPSQLWSAVMTMYFIGGFKFFVYDVVGRLFLRSTMMKKWVLWFYIIYGIAFLFDIFTFFISMEPLSINLSIIMTVLYTAPFLFVCNTVLAGAYVFKAIKHRKE